MEISDGYREAQRAVVGSLLIDPEHTLGLVMDRLRPEQFRDEWRTLFAAVRSQWLDQRPVDPVTVIQAAGEGYGKLVREAMELTPTAANVAAYADVVRDEDALDRLRGVGMALAGAADVPDARKILEAAGPLIADRPGIRVWSAQELLQDFYQRMGEERKPDYLPWGIRALDEQLTAEPGDFIILGADSSVGKTALAVQVAWHMAARGRRVGFFSLETSARKLADRLVAQRARVAMEDIKKRTMAVKDFQEVAALGDAAAKVPFAVIPCAGASVEDLRALTVANRFEVIFVDYVQLLQAPGRERWEIVTNISMQLHTLAQSLGVAVVALSQITAQSKSGKRAPDKDDLRESKQLKQDADLILLMSLEDPDDNESLRWLKVVKNKDGPLLSVCLKLDAAHMDFTATDSRAIGEWRRKKSRPATFRDLPDGDKKDEEAIRLAGW